MVTFPDIPRLIDRFIVDFNNQIIKTLPWLNNPLGKIEELSRNLDGTYIKVPAMHLSDGEYIEVLPDDKLVNYSWFNFSPIEFTNRLTMAKIKTQCDWNLYVNLDSIVGETSAREIDNVKFNVINSIKSISVLSGAIRIKSISDSYKDAYRGFNITNIEDRYFMQPYAALNIKFDVYLRNNNCSVNEYNQLTADSGANINNNELYASGAI